VRSYARVPPGTAVAYRHRDPEWLSPARRAQLEASDRPETDAALTSQQAARAARIAQFAQLRDAGLRIGEAARAMGISRDTARQYDRARRQT